MITKYFNNFIILFCFYNFYWFLFKITTINYFKYQILFSIPKIFNLFIKIYEKNFLFFYVVDNFLSIMFFLYLIKISLEIIFPIAGVVYNQKLFEENII